MNKSLLNRLAKLEEQRRTGKQELVEIQYVAVWGDEPDDGPFVARWEEQ